MSMFDLKKKFVCEVSSHEMKPDNLIIKSGEVLWLV